MTSKFFVLLFLFFTFSTNAQETKLVILGSGNPNPDPEHSGSSIAIITNDVPYIVDFGPGLVRKFSSLTKRYGGQFPNLNVKDIKTVFLTHLHSDHTVGFPDLILTPWVMGRNEPLKVYGPEGIKNMTEHILKAYQEDIKYRLYGLEPANNEGWRVIANEFNEGLIYQDSLIKVEAFNVIHGSWPNAYGFRFTTKDKVIVISGDTKPCDNIIQYAKGADILVHEVYYHKGWSTKNDFWKKYHKANHTSSYELAKIANETNPGLIVLYHTLYWGGSNQDIINEIKETYNGDVVVSEDLNAY